MNIEINKQESKGISNSKVLMWIAIVSMVMIFAGLTSAYMVRQAEGNWMNIILPKKFWFSTAAVILSSVSLNIAIAAIKKDLLSKSAQYMLVTSTLGGCFLILQFLAWGDMVDQGLYFVGNNASAQFLYALTGLHASHMIGGIIAVIYTTVMTYKQKYNSHSREGIEVFALFWHFLTVLWVYIFFFLLLNSQK